MLVVKSQSEKGGIIINRYRYTLPRNERKFTACRLRVMARSRRGPEGGTHFGVKSRIWYLPPFAGILEDTPAVKRISIYSSLTANREGSNARTRCIKERSREFQTRCRTGESIHSNSVTNPGMFEFDIGENRFIQIRWQTNSLESQADALKARREKSTRSD